MIGDYLLMAAGQGDLVTADYLIAYGADINYTNIHGESSLHVASRSGHMDFVQMIVESGGEVNLNSNEGHSPLFYAAAAKHLDIVEYLTGKGAKPDIHSSIILGDSDFVEKFITNNGTANFDFFRYAVIHKQDKILSFLLKSCPQSFIDKSDISILHIAAANGNIFAAEIFIDNFQMNVNLQTSLGYTPLTFAAQGFSPTMVQFLIKNAALVDLADKVGRTPIFESARLRKLENTEILISNGAQINLTDDFGFTPLLCAFQSTGTDNIVKALINAGAMLDFSCEPNRNPLYISVAQKRHEIIKLLLGKFSLHE